MSKNKPNYDAIIIGAGLGGISCGLHLAQEKKKVAIFEQHFQPGGSCSSFRRMGFNFDAGAHIFSDCHRAGILNIILALLQIEYEFIPCDPVDRYFFPSFTFEVRKNSFENDLIGKFPQEATGIKFFLKLIRNINKLAQDNKSFRRKTYEDLLEEFICDGRLKKILSAQWLYLGLPPSKISAISAGNLFNSYWYGGAFYPKGGSQAFVNTLVRRYQDLGGHIFYKKRVSKINIIQEKLVGFTLENGSQYSASTVIHNGPVSALPRMIEEKYLGEHVLKYIREGQKSTSLFVTYWGIRADKNYVKGKNGWYFDSWDYNNDDLILITIPTLYDPTLAPKGCHIVETFTLCKNDTTINWRDSKVQSKKTILEKLNRIFPHFEQRIIVSEAASPATIERYTLNPGGSVYGWAFLPEQSSSQRMDFRLGIEGLYQTGHWTIPGAGVSPAILSGRIVARHILNQEGLF